MNKTIRQVSLKVQNFDDYLLQDTKFNPNPMN